MTKNIFSLIAIAVIGTSTAMAKTNVIVDRNAHQPHMEYRAVIAPTTTTVTTTTQTIKPNGTRVITTTTTKTVTTAKPAAIKPAKKVCHKKHAHGFCKDCKKTAHDMHKR